MKRLTLVALFLALFAGLAEAQPAAGNTRFYKNLRVDGQFYVAAGTAGTPAVAIGSTTTGLYNRASTRLSIANGGLAGPEFDSDGLYLASTDFIYFLSGALGTGGDAGIARDSAGVLKITNGSSGLGTLYTSAGSAVGVGVGIGSNLVGFYAVGNTLFTAIGGNRVFQWDGVNALRFYSTAQVGWSNGTGADNPLDTAQARFAAGVQKDTDGSTGIRHLRGGGAAIASAATLALPTGNVFHVTGTTNVTSITATNLQSGVVVTIIFDDALTFTDGGNLKLAGNFVTTADDTITLAYDGSNFYEIARAVN